MKKLRERLLNLLYPPKCAFCRRLTEDGRTICPVCEGRLPRPDKGEAVRQIPPLDGCLSPLYYTDSVRESLLRYKFRGLTAYAGIYGELMAACLKEHGVEADAIVWVPLSRQRRRKRGYDQAQLLAKELAAQTGLPCLKLLKKTKNNPAQSGTGGLAARQRNVQGVYEAQNVPEGIRVLLVDDIVTTGSTLSAAARTLLDAGAACVIGITAAQTPKSN
ncbi:MAG: ComF family protein [Oscillospiraceae bacterium]|nr:ComF family protein [Oscillospiraceae bacterium]